MGNIDKKQIEIIEYFYGNKDVLNGISKSKMDDLAYFIFNLLRMNPSNKLMSKMITILYRMCFRDDITLEEVWEIYWNLKSLLFNHSEIEIISGNIRELYTYIFKSICEVIPDRYSYQDIDSRNLETIVIVTSQLLDLGHAPTTRVFDYAYVLQNKLHKKVVIINDSNMNFITNQNLDANIRFNYIEEYEKLDYIAYKDETFRFIQSPYKMPNISAMISLIDSIYEINPGLVYNIGADSLVADYCSKFTTTVCLPCSNDLPVSCSKYLMVGRKITTDDQTTIKELLDYQEIIETLINYEYRENEVEYTRKQFNLGEDEFLISIVGNRLDSEVTNEFINILNNILGRIKKCSIVFVGDICNKERILDLINEEHRIYMLGSLNEASKLIKECNLYLNPKRSGGGRSSFEALHFGIPVITLKYGDVYYTCGDEFAVSNEEQIIDLVDKYISDYEFYKSKSEKAVARAVVLSDIKQTLQNAINEVMLKERRK